MKKLYLFGDSFSLFDSDLKDSMSSRIEFNTHHSLANDHILKLVKLKLLKLSKMDIKKEDNINILVQLTVCSRVCVFESMHPDTSEMMRKHYSYLDEMTKYGDSDVFQNKYYTLYPHFSARDSGLVKMVFTPYLGFFINNNEFNILNDLLLEITLLKKLAESIGVNLEYFFYSSDFNRILGKKITPIYGGKKVTTIDSSHIQFGEFDSMHSYIASTRPDYFVSKLDIHFNNNGNRWYINWLKERYDI